MDHIPDRTQKIRRAPVEKRSIPVVCSWCGVRFEIKRWNVEEGKRTRITHGMCPDCADKMRRENNW